MVIWRLDEENAHMQIVKHMQNFCSCSTIPLYNTSCTLSSTKTRESYLVSLLQSLSYSKWNVHSETEGNLNHLAKCATENDSFVN